jgi:hypothetical protein
MMNSKTRAMLIGTVAGALLGAIFGWVASDGEGDGEESGAAQLGPADYFQLGIGILTLGRQFGAMLRKM